MVQKDHHKVEAVDPHLNDTIDQTAERLHAAARVQDFAQVESIGKSEYKHITSQKPEVLLGREREVRKEIESLSPPQLAAFKKLEAAHADMKNPAEKLTVEQMELAILKGNTQRLQDIVLAYGGHPEKANNVMKTLGDDLPHLSQGKGSSETSLDADWDPKSATLTLAGQYKSDLNDRHRLVTMDFAAISYDTSPSRGQVTEYGNGSPTGDNLAVSHDDVNKSFAQLAIGKRPEKNF